MCYGAFCEFAASGCDSPVVYAFYHSLLCSFSSVYLFVVES